MQIKLISLRYRVKSVEGRLVARSGDAFKGLLLLLFSGMVIGEQRRVNKTSTKEAAYGREQDDYENSNEMCVIKMLKPVKKKKALFLTLIIKHSFEGI
ncbi:hypothetical protein F2Q70_00020486 [Brassica cretica]|uniref:Uncharacterized protein n=1 Tax=Brassica cretica TaxID=69181 RepID=A0A8S9GTZ1_BRACR|nr:hypothetical protein F2Q70_00020486 [Brassica cretica]